MGMRRNRSLSSTTLISLGLSSLALALVLAGWSLGLVPDAGPALARARAQAGQAVAARCTAAVTAATHPGEANPDKPAQAPDLTGEVGRVLTDAAARDPDLRSAILRNAVGEIVCRHGTDNSAATGAALELAFKIYDGPAAWGSLELVYATTPAGDGAAEQLFERIGHPGLRLGVAVGASGFLCFGLYLRYTLRQLDPASVVPPRVRAMMDTLAEGVLVINRDGLVVLANQKFASAAGCSPDDLLGRSAHELGWADPAHPEAVVPPASLPWTATLAGQGAVRGRTLLLRPRGPHGRPDTGSGRTFAVNAAPITGPDGGRRGALVTFDDQTEVERLNAELSASNGQLATANGELERLATTDPLTSCVNRRAFMDAFARLWATHQASSAPLACVMVDVDKFKSINDRFGHAVGDRVLVDVAKLLLASADPELGDLVCRYGGEEFCLLLPGRDLTAAAAAAERVRRTIEAENWPFTPVTASLGVASTVGAGDGEAVGARDAKELLDRADQALYASKRTGRNRVTAWSPDVAKVTEASPSGGSDMERRSAATDVPRPAAAHPGDPTFDALTTALAHRHAATASHCRRVADLCRVAAVRLVPAAGLAHLEAAALLHDIGKMGVPDAVLLKPAPLTDAERDVMRAHDQIGVDILSAAGVPPQVLWLVAAHHHRYATPNESATAGGP
ncbi:MAG TPA: diguanylate cyclase, partial [Tepidisphaeraceae bacterium]|nr:diguanylate cyclase [Tepidisphaeraceae bacterium]